MNGMRKSVNRRAAASPSWPSDGLAVRDVLESEAAECDYAARNPKSRSKTYSTS